MPLRPGAGYSDDLAKFFQYRRKREKRPIDVVSRLASAARKVNDENADWRRGMIEEYISEQRSEDALEVQALAEAVKKTDPGLLQRVTDRHMNL